VISDIDILFFAYNIVGRMPFQTQPSTDKIVVHLKKGKHLDWGWHDGRIYIFWVNSIFL